jgi:hypothetical protein
MTPVDGDDDRVVRELADLLDRLDPVPPRVVAAARASLAWRDRAAIVAELIADSAAAAPAGVRGPGPARLLSFHADGLDIEVEVGRIGPRHQLTGQLLPPGPARVRVDHGGGRAETVADEWGRFVVDGVGPGPLRLRCEPAGRDGPPVATPWTNI